jgi:transcription elongation factor GreA
MAGSELNLSLNDAANEYLAGLPAENKSASQPEIFKFIRWFGREKRFTDLTPAEVGNYAERLSISDTDYTRKLELVKGFLAYGKKKSWSKTNLGVHLKARKGKAGPRTPVAARQVEAIQMTREGYTKVEAEIASLKETSFQLTREITRAAADKDFRENAPLHAARERKGQVEGRLMELEAMLKAAVIVDEDQGPNLKAGIGKTVVLSDLSSGQEVRYTLVSSSEVDPLNGKISAASPIGRALLDKERGETAEITAPAGKLRYRIVRIES